MGLDPSVWGPKAWFFLHSVTLAYPDNPTPEQQKQYADFFELLKFTLPCPGCRYHYAETIKHDPPKNHTSSRKELVRWLLSIHNQVNKTNNKPNFLNQNKSKVNNLFKINTTDFEEIVNIIYEK